MVLYRFRSHERLYCFIVYRLRLTCHIAIASVAGQAQTKSRAENMRELCLIERHAEGIPYQIRPICTVT